MFAAIERGTARTPWEYTHSRENHTALDVGGVQAVRYCGILLLPSPARRDPGKAPPSAERGAHDTHIGVSRAIATAARECRVGFLALCSGARYSGARIGKGKLP
jgi:hypothetical protein